MKTAFAFPVFESKRADTDYDLTDPGMTLRDYFAGQALAGLFSDINWFDKVEWQRAATAAYGLADAMLKSREAYNEHH